MIEVIGSKCISCTACAYNAIAMHKIINSSVNKADFQDIWVFAEQKDGVIASVTLELLGKGHELADQMEAELSAIPSG